MELELVPKSELPEWGKEDDKAMFDFIERRKSGKLRLEGGQF